MSETSCIRVFSQASAGVTKARNIGLRQLPPQTEFVSFLDSDDISPAGRFKADLACFAGDSGLELIYSRITLVDSIDDEALVPAADSNCVAVRGIHLSAGIFARKFIDQTGSFDEAFQPFQLLSAKFSPA
jgi:hypothetical protein